MDVITFDHVRAVGWNPRIHGNGFIQVDMPGNQRIHVFGHPDVPRQRVPTPVHDHRWSFVSTILCGTLINVVWRFETDDRAPHTHFVCGYEQSKVGGDDTRLIPTDETGHLVLHDTITRTAGWDYVHPAFWLHETFANEPTITLMRKEQDVLPCPGLGPRVLCRIGMDPDNTFSRHGWDEDTVWGMVEDAFRWMR